MWGVQCQILYPGANIIVGSHRARTWEEAIGIPFHEVRIEGNAHLMDIVFSELSVEEVHAGYCPYRIEKDGVAEKYAAGSKMPLNPPGP